MSINVVRIDFLDGEGTVVRDMASVGADHLNHVAAEEETYNGMYFTIRIADETEDSASIQVTVESVDTERDYAVKASASMDFARTAGHTYESGKVIPYHGSLADGTKQYLEQAGYTLLPSSATVVPYVTARGVLSHYYFALDQNNDGRLDLGELCGLDGFAYLPGCLLGRQRLTATTPQAMQLIAYPLPKNVTVAVFKLENVSGHRGICGNHGSSLEDDFSFLSFTNDTGPVAALVEGRAARTPIFCKDFGGYCEAVLELYGDDGVLREVARLKIPADEDGDGMADAWERTHIEMVRAQEEKDGTSRLSPGFTFSDLTAAWDEEWHVSGANTNLGDGIPAFDEYRGFIVQGRFLGTSPFELDVFLAMYGNRGAGIDDIIRDYEIGTAWFADVRTELGYIIHRIDDGEYSGSQADSEYRSINFNGPAGTSQYCVIFRLTAPGVYDPHSDQTAARTYGTTGTPIPRAIPKNVGVVKFFFEPYVNCRYKEIIGYSDIPAYLPVGSCYESIPKHEFGHCVFLDHGIDDGASDPSGVDHTGACIMIHNGTYALPQPEDHTRDFCGECQNRTKVVE